MLKWILNLIPLEILFNFFVRALKNNLFPHDEAEKGRN